jgi:hypothetical protein
VIVVQVLLARNVLSVLLATVDLYLQLHDVLMFQV